MVNEASDPIFCCEIVEMAIEHVAKTNNPARDGKHALNFGVKLANKFAHKLNPEDRVRLGEEMKNVCDTYLGHNPKNIENFEGSKIGATFKAAYILWTEKYLQEEGKEQSTEESQEKPLVKAYDGFHEWTTSA